MIRTIAVIGAGPMGHGIAESFAMHGYDVKLLRLRRSSACGRQARDPRGAGVARRGRLHRSGDDSRDAERIRYTATSAGRDDRRLVIEAAPEKLELKQALFAARHLLTPGRHLRQQTSTLPLKSMMAKLPPARRSRTMVNHWYFPAHLMPIAELSFFGNTPKQVYDEVAALYASINKQTVKVLKDVPGLVANRLQQGVAREAFSISNKASPSPKTSTRR